MFGFIAILTPKGRKRAKPDFAMRLLVHDHSDSDQLATAPHDDLFTALLDDAPASSASSGIDLVAMCSPSTSHNHCGRVLVQIPVLILASLLWGCDSIRAPSPKSKVVLNVAAASDLRFAMEELIADFETRQETPGLVDIRVSYGSSGNFYAQLTQRAPFDMFFSADIEYPEKLVEAGLARPGSLFEYAVGRLVIWAPNQERHDVRELQWEALRSANKVAIANPDHAPYGRAAVAAMKSSGVYEEVRGKFVFGENISQTAQFIQSGGAEVGIIALALALSPAMSAGVYWEIPTDQFPPMRQGGLITPWSKSPELAEAFRAYVVGEDGREVLRRWGFYLPGGQP